MTKKSSFFHFWLFSCVISHSFGVLGRFTTTVRTRYMFDGTTKNSSFSCFLDVFMSYFPHFWGSGRFTCLTVMTKILLFSCFVAVCMSYFPQFGRSRVIYMFERYDQKLVVFCVLWLFS